MPPGVTPLMWIDGAAVKNVMKSLVVVAMNATCRRSFVHASNLKSSKRGKTVNERVKDKGYYTFWQRAGRGKISTMRWFVCGVEVSKERLV